MGADSRTFFDTDSPFGEADISQKLSSRRRPHELGSVADQDQHPI